MAQLRGRGTAAAQGADDLELDPWEDDAHALKSWENLDIGAMALKGAQEVIKRRPVLLSVWAAGLLLAALAGGVPVSDASAEAYSLIKQQAEVVDSRDLGHAFEELGKLDEAYYNTQGWFGACNETCQRAKDKVDMARSEVLRLQEHRDKVLAEARHEVGIWSTFGVQDVRDCFWTAWARGKEIATRWTMIDALFLSVGGGDEKAVMIVVRLVVRYLMNLTMGLIAAFFCFVYNVYCLTVSYGETALSGLAFLLLAAVAGLAVVSAYLGALFGTAAAGGLMLVRQAALQQAALEQGGARQRLQHDFCGEAKCNV